MAKKVAVKKAKPAKLKAGKSTSKVGGIVKKAKDIFGGKGGKGGKRRKKSAMFYAREIQRLKLKKRYEKVKLGISMR